MLVARGWRVTGSRWRSRRSRAVPASALRTLQRSRGQVAREDLDAWRARRSLRRREEAEDDDVPLEALESGPVDEDTIDLDLGASGPARRFFGHPLTYLLPLAARARRAARCCGRRCGRARSTPTGSRWPSPTPPPG